LRLEGPTASSKDWTGLSISGLPAKPISDWLNAGLIDMGRVIELQIMRNEVYCKYV